MSRTVAWTIHEPGYLPASDPFETDDESATIREVVQDELSRSIPEDGIGLPDYEVDELSAGFCDDIDAYGEAVLDLPDGLILTGLLNPEQEA